jgi:hypothetical protein
VLGALDGGVVAGIGHRRPCLVGCAFAVGATPIKEPLAGVQR